MKQRRWAEGSLSVGYYSATLFDTARKCCVASQKSTCLVPTKMFLQMKEANLGADWKTAEGEGGNVCPPEIWFGRFLLQVLTVRELHLIPYDQLPIQNKSDANDDEATLPERLVAAATTPLLCEQHQSASRSRKRSRRSIGKHLSLYYAQFMPSD